MTPSAGHITLKCFKYSGRHTLMLEQERVICPVGGTRFATATYETAILKQGLDVLYNRGDPKSSDEIGRGSQRSDELNMPPLPALSGKQIMDC